MRNFFGLAILGCAVLAAVPASASTSNFNFISCSGNGSTQCNSDLTAYGPVTSTGATPPVTATVTAYFVQGTSNGPTTSDNLQTGEVGAYSGAGIGDCETQSGSNCSSPQHQVDNGINPNSGNNGNTPYDFEFLLVQFSAAVNLTDVQLGNFGGGASNPFNATYFTSTAAVGSISTINTMTYSSLLSGADDFSAIESTSCTAGTNTLDQNTQGTLSSNCDTEAIDSVTGTNVTYLLIGASVSSSQVGDDYFKLQDIDAHSSGQASPTPEPATFGLLGLALTGLGVYGRKRKSRS